MSDSDDDFGGAGGSVGVIADAFGRGCDLYRDVLRCDRTADRAALRKAYYRAALRHHPDRHPQPPANGGDPGAAAAAAGAGGADGDSPEAHKLKFQAISLAYRILCDDELRAEYDATGCVPGHAGDDDFDAGDRASYQSWKDYFANIFGSVTTGKIDAFAAKYKCSDEERRDVLKEFQRHRGDLVKVLECVMLSAPRDVPRWVEDYIRPALAAGGLPDADRLHAAMEKSLVKCQRMAEKENQRESAGGDSGDDDEDDEETETEDEEEPGAAVARTKAAPSPRKKSKTSHPQAKKGKSKSSKDASMEQLVQAIQSKRQNTASVFASLAQRYGGKLEDDPLDDAAFAQAQARLGQSGKKRGRG